MFQEQLKARADARNIPYKGKRKNLKAEFKQRCINRLKERRQEKLNLKRVDLVVKDVMEEQFQGLTHRMDMVEEIDDDESNVHVRDIESFTEDDQQQLRDLWDTIEAELLFEGKSLLTSSTLQILESKLCLDYDDALTAQAEKELEFEEEEEKHVISTLGQESNEITCPVCLSSPLHQTRCLVWCECGLTLNLKSDGIGLGEIGEMLQSMYARHGRSGCDYHLQFRKDDLQDILIGYCDKCNAFECV
eukprot:m.73977 g.73977  ORF g.73977 m.73977 type:complete len:247 (+) comp8434_c0_seq8:22-762(+)